LCCRIALRQRRPTYRTRAAIAAGNRRQCDAGVAPAGNSVLLIRLLIRHEEEQFVLLDGSAKHPSILVLIQNQLRSARGVPEPVVGIQSRVAEEFKRRPMEIVGARLGDDINVGARIAPVTRVVGRGLNLEFLNGVRIGNPKRSVLRAFMGAVEAEPVIDCNAVLQKGVLAEGATVHGDVRRRLPQRG